MMIAIGTVGVAVVLPKKSLLLGDRHKFRVFQLSNSEEFESEGPFGRIRADDYSKEGNTCERSLREPSFQRKIDISSESLRLHHCF